jgi:hypothetical protein
MSPEITDDQKLEIFSRGVAEGKKHSKPSAETENFIHMAEKKIEVMDYRMQSMESDIKEIKETVKKSEERFDMLIEKLDARYALKTTETAVNRIGWLVVSAVILALLGLILKK